MTPEAREAVLANAKYLRNLRPIDPTEVADYVEGHPHPAGVRRIIREAALDLGVIERGDGTFVPVPEEPVPHQHGTIETFPEGYADRLEDLLAERLGPTWWEGDTGDELRATLRRVKEDYYRGRPVAYDATVAAAYAVYHLPDYYAALRYVLGELTARGLLPRSLRVADIGAGVGGPALGLLDSIPEDALLAYHAVEPSPAADVLEYLLDDAGRNVHPTLHRTTAEAFEPDGPYDLVLLANVLSELDDPLGVAARYADHLASDGSLVLLAPADRETAIGLRRVERALAAEAGLTVYSPTIRLWPGHEPTDRGWSFSVHPDLAVPGFQARLDAAGGGQGEFVNVDVQYAYAILRRDGQRRIDVTLDEGRFARFADAEAHVTERIDCAAIKLSADLAAGGNPLFKVGDGSERDGVFAVLTKETGLNRSLRAAAYGDLLVFEAALLLRNDDEAAYNLVVDDETVVDRAGP